MIYLFPGLGSEYAGMAGRFAAEFPGTQSRLSEWFGPMRAQRILAEDDMAVETPDQELALQQRVHALNLLWWRLAAASPAHAPASGFAGHSLGFYAALVAAGSLSERASLQVIETVPLGFKRAICLVRIHDQV